VKPDFIAAHRRGGMEIKSRESAFCIA